MRASTLGSLCLSVAAGVAFFTYSTSSAFAAEPSYENGQVVETAPFTGVVLAGGGDITIRRGETSSVRIIEGGEAMKIEVDDGSLSISCKKPCPRNTKLEVEVTTARLEAIVIAGGGEIEVKDSFDKVDELAIVITGGGVIDAFGAPADDVEIAITGGGEIMVTAEKTLDVAIIGGGTITYRGEPEIDRSIIGGGTITRD
ncbi:GIN domain-containing protein [Aquisalinus flavus]|uniref:Putative auto-transporter adhesin head GIN domain-containing protein n=1 Tax=Aquisalinus flavus TaxID=1526572 RepID=A0A8J2V2X7_9PROT|nr:DUF2807 domain-containing protein [Aquisalinus flavus]MBD0425463.1 DUF2807 domain-containing protein [Aquisalinus flavus]UNE48900.1 hypothetical protein FF099_12990 [Aquisalinus flavus]GGD15854.1 hypothetical protein GCM10011342_25810 [Aquisalinus flavus]